MWLSLTRKSGQEILIGDDIVIRVGDITLGEVPRVKILLNAPKHVEINRRELVEEKESHGRQNVARSTAGDRVFSQLMANGKDGNGGQ